MSVPDTALPMSPAGAVGAMVDLSADLQAITGHCEDSIGVECEEFWGKD